jgi:hypothetical protein
MDELKLKRGIIVTEDHADELVEDDKIITIVPAYQLFCLSHNEKMALLQLNN